MKWRLLLVLLVASAGAWPQGPEVTVRLYSIQSPSQLRLVPQTGKTRFRICPPCRDVRLASAREIRAKGEQILVSAENSPADSAKVSGSFAIEVQPNAALAVNYPLEIRARGGRLLLTLRLPLEDYVAAVLAGESGSFSSEESLKAMAVAVRSYAVRFRGRHQADGFDFCDTTHCQDLRLAATTDALKAATEATEGELLWYEGQPAATYYHRNCGGVTEASHFVWSGLKVPYLQQHADNYCAVRGRGEWHSEISKEDLGRALAAAGIHAPRNWDSLQIVSRTPSGRVEKLRLAGDTNLQLAASALRFAVGRALGWNLIRSELYEVQDAGDHFVFRGCGAGHGVGLCQAGTDQMGREGKSYREILEFYYPATVLGLTAQGFGWRGLSGERMELLTTRPQEDQWLVTLADRLIREAEEESGWEFKIRPQLRLYPSVAAFRDATGLPGWVAASTRGRVVRLQPVRVLRSAGTLEATLRHELFHLLVEFHAHPKLPLWFREGVVLHLTEAGRASGLARSRTGRPNQEDVGLEELDRVLRQPRSLPEMRHAYQTAQWSVEELIRKDGKEVVLGWVERGLPPGLLLRSEQTPQAAKGRQ